MMHFDISLKIDRGLIAVSCLIALCCAGCSQSVSKTIRYTNPIIGKGLADPCVVYEDGSYYMFGTGFAEDGKGIQIYKAADLSGEWLPIGGAVPQGTPENWNYKHFWAPEVLKHDGKFYLYYTASPEDSPANSGNRVGVAVAENIEGPYEDAGPVIRHASIDGSPFVDTDGQLYMYYTIEHRNADGLKAGQVYADRMVSCTQAEGNPKRVMAEYEWQEGPNVQRIGRKYLLTFSQGSWTDDTYCLRYAYADSPYGPFRLSDRVIMRSNEAVKGPGHHFFFKDGNGKQWIAYHGWDTLFTTRYPRIDPIFLSEDTVRFDGPTFTPQEVTVEVGK